MLYFISRLVLTFFLPVLLAHTDKFSEVRFKKIVFFGDSYTDTGNVYKLTHRTWPLSPPYYYGRSCNGPNWVDQLEVYDKKNYAYGGATTDNNLVQGYSKVGTVPVPGILQQVDTYLSHHDSNNIDSTLTLHVFWGGGNDFIYNPTLSIDGIVASLLKSVEKLLARGAKHILIFNQISGQYIPIGLTLAPAATLNALTIMFNTALSTRLQAIKQQNTQASLNIVDINSLIKKVVTTTSDYFTNTVGSCWKVINPTTIVNKCNDPNKYVFVDDVHFSTNVHRLIADAVQPFLLPSYAVNSAGCYIHPV